MCGEKLEIDLVGWQVIKATMELGYIMIEIVELFSLRRSRTVLVQVVSCWFNFINKSFDVAHAWQQSTFVWLMLVWPDLAKFYKSGNFLAVYFLFGKIVNPLW